MSRLLTTEDIPLLVPGTILLVEKDMYALGYRAGMKLVVKSNHHLTSNRRQYLKVAILDDNGEEIRSESEGVFYSIYSSIIHCSVYKHSTEGELFINSLYA